MVRRARPDDLDSVTQLIEEFRDWWGKAEPSADRISEVLSGLLDDDDTEFFLAFDGDNPVGVCQLRYRLSGWTGAEDCWLEDLFVAADARGHGYGRDLVEAAVTSAAPRGCRRVELDVNEQNKVALRVYESLGFTTEPKPPGRTLFIARRL